MMILLQIRNLDSFRKVVIDSIAAAQKQQLNAIDYIGKIDSFYNNAWTKLAILFGLIGVIVPLVINYIQTKRNEKEKETLKKEVNTEMKSELQTLRDELKSEIDTYLKSEVSKIQHASEGVSYHIQSDLYFDKGKYKEAFGETVNALTCYMIGEDYPNFNNALEDLWIRFKKIAWADIASLKSECSDYYSIEALIDKLEKSNDIKYTCFIVRLKTEFSKLIPPLVKPDQPPPTF